MKLNICFRQKTGAMFFNFVSLKVFFVFIFCLFLILNLFDCLFGVLFCVVFINN